MIRPFHPTDASAWTALVAASFGIPRSVVPRLLAQPAERVVAADDGQVVGLAERAGRLARVAVAPAWRGRGVGRELWDALRPQGPLAATVLDDDAGSREWAERRGFEVVRHSVGCVLDLADAPARPAPPPGWRTWTLPPEPGPDEWAMAYDAFARCCADTPDLAGHLPSRVELEAVVPFPPAAAFGWLEGALVACCLAAPDGPDEWLVVSTGVDPSWRRRGLAAAVKTALEDVARHHGVRRLRANVHSDNAAMQALNRRLGYRPARGVWHLAT